MQDVRRGIKQSELGEELAVRAGCVVLADSVLSDGMVRVRDGRISFVGAAAEGGAPTHCAAQTALR